MDESLHIFLFYENGLFLQKFALEMEGHTWQFQVTIAAVQNDHAVLYF